jgi:hypothetical protein
LTDGVHCLHEHGVRGAAALFVSDGLVQLVLFGVGEQMLLPSMNRDYQKRKYR